MLAKSCIDVLTDAADELPVTAAVTVGTNAEPLPVVGVGKVVAAVSPVLLSTKVVSA